MKLTSIVCLAFVFITCCECPGENAQSVVPSPEALLSEKKPPTIEPGDITKTSEADVLCPTANEEARRLYNDALVFARQGNYERAKEGYLKAVEKDPRYCDAMDNIGQLLRREGDIKQAISWYKRSIAAKPDNAVAHQDLAVAYGMQGNADKTLEEYQWLVRNDPGNPEGYYGLGMTFLDLGKPSEAIMALERAEILYRANSSPFLEDAQYLLGAAFFGRKEYRKARDYLLLSYPSRKGDPSANYLLGLCYLDPSIKDSVKSREFLLKARNLGVKIPPELLQELDK